MARVDHALALLDAPGMGERFRRELPGLDAFQVRACAIRQSRRRVSRKTEEQGAPYLGVVYELELHEPRSGAGLTQWLYAKAYSRDASATAFTEANAAAQARPRAGPPLARLQELDALVWAMPNDPAMPQLPRFLDADCVRDELQRLLGGPGGHTAAAGSAAAQIVRYEPESHCMVRFELPLNGDARVVYGKTYADDRWSEVARRLAVLSANGESDRGAFAIARPLGGSAALRAVWQDEAHGVPLRDALNGPDGARWMRRLTGALARLQGSKLMGDANLTPALLLDRTRKQRKKLVRADAQLAPALDAALAVLERELPVGRAPVVLHGDFHVDQMLCSDERITLFDFDNFAVGSPAHDIADFASQLLTDTGFDAARRVELARDFIDGCLAHAPRSPAWGELDWYLRLLLLRKAYSFFVRYRSGWRERVLAAAALAARGLEAVRPPRLEACL